MYRNNTLITFSDYDDVKDIGIYKRKRSRELIKVENINIMNPKSRLLARKIMNYLSDYKIYNYDTNDGILNHLAIRNNENDEFMLEFYIHKYDESLLKKIIEYNNDDIKSIYYQINKNKNNFRNNFCLLKGEKYLTYNVNNKKISIKAGSFFQTNNFVLQDMYIDIKKKLIKGNSFIDLYCGVGIMSILVNENYNECIGIEINQNAIDVANYNKSVNNSENCKFICSPVEKIINKINLENSILFINPPRRGLYENVIKELNNIKSSVKQMLYLSCCKESLERDLKLFDYKYKYVNEYNMFPETNHKEYLVELFV